VYSAAEIGSELAEQVGHRLEKAECTAWRAAALRQTGHEAEARRLHVRAETQVNRLQMPPTDLYFDALCAYHHLGGEVSQALEVRLRELETIQGWGRLAYECRTRVRLCWLRARLGQPCAGDRAAAVVAAEKLRKPGPYLTLLERIDRGEIDHEPFA
jgi:hypothetical protein